jgi:hypothetical protein
MRQGLTSAAPQASAWNFSLNSPAKVWSPAGARPGAVQRTGEAAAGRSTSEQRLTAHPRPSPSPQLSPPRQISPPPAAGDGRSPGRKAQRLGQRGVVELRQPGRREPASLRGPGQQRRLEGVARAHGVGHLHGHRWGGHGPAGCSRRHLRRHASPPPAGCRRPARRRQTGRSTGPAAAAQVFVAHLQQVGARQHPLQRGAPHVQVGLDIGADVSP